MQIERPIKLDHPEWKEPSGRVEAIGAQSMPKACPVCGSRRWRRHGGVATCEEGHVLQASCLGTWIRAGLQYLQGGLVCIEQNFRTEEAVLTEIGQHQLLRRRLRQNKAKALRRQVGEKDPDGE